MTPPPAWPDEGREMSEWIKPDRESTQSELGIPLYITDEVKRELGETT